MRRYQLAALPLAASLAFASAPASAAITLVDVYPGTDCSGQGGFSNCYAFPGGTQQGEVEGGTPAVYKLNYSAEDGFEISNDYPTITGDEFDITWTEEGNVFSFTYTPGEGDPALHYFSVKQGSNFALFTDDGGAAITSATLNLSTYFDQPGYSHATFFNTGMSAVPEPATWALLLFGFGAIGASMRRRKAATTPRLRLRTA